MNYQIKYCYDSGDSFSQYPNITGILELEFKSLEVAEQNLKRIEEHYEQYKALNKTYYPYEKRKKDFLGLNKNKDWYVNGDPENCIILYTDDGKPFQMYCPWCGYFESLNYVTIESKPLTYYA
jgi:hypothetical protein